MDFNPRIEPQHWQPRELDELNNALSLFVNIFGAAQLARPLGAVRIARVNTGKSLGLAYKDRIELSASAPFSAWSLIHELAHVWDAKHDWTLSLELETYTSGFTSPAQSRNISRTDWDAAALGAASQPGQRGRKPGVNKAGYFYGDKPSGSNWSFNRKEDFAEAVVMYCGWGRDNVLSRTAHGRITRYLLPNGSKDPTYNIIDNWLDYAKYFYPAGGDYTKTKRWEFIEHLSRQ